VGELAREIRVEHRPGLPALYVARHHLLPRTQSPIQNRWARARAHRVLNQAVPAGLIEEKTRNGILSTRYTEPNVDQHILLQQLNLTLPPQPPPRITTSAQLHTTSQM
jgi:hypothetical protein